MNVKDLKSESQDRSVMDDAPAVPTYVEELVSFLMSMR